ncbi:hypothetical protein [Armatimonas sp.]|uniref:hypothetical protein n=1 Tax=Armatimonas sp. TaxID=1872638 RepID=UPI0037521905
MPLSVDVPAELSEFAQLLGFSLGKHASPLPPHPRAVRRAWAEGARSAICAAPTAEALWQLRPLALFAAAFGEPLRSGTFHSGLRVRGGLIATEWRTAQKGALLFAHNPMEAPCVGSVFPAFDERTVAAGETLIWAHDFPLGPSENYLAAYAGLVKSDATLLTAHLRPDPFPGARFFVVGTPSERREVSVFNAGPGEVIEVVFSETPAVFAAGVSQVVAVPEALAPHLWILETATWLGPTWELSHAGEIIHHATGWRETVFVGDETPRSAQLQFEQNSPEVVWLNGIPVTGSDVLLLPSENHLLVRGAHGPAFIIPDGACFQVELTFTPQPPSGFTKQISRPSF